MNAPELPTSIRRADWLRVLARASTDELVPLAERAAHGHRFEWLRAPEHGLAMVRARIGNGGDRFNLGEVTVTRCVVRHADTAGTPYAGVGYVMGRDAARASRVAELDALLQRADLHPALWQDVVEPLRARRLARDRAEAARTAASRVRFFTLQAEQA